MKKLVEIDDVIVQSTHTTKKGVFDERETSLTFYSSQGCVKFSPWDDKKFVKDMERLKGVIDVLITSVEATIE